MSKDRGDGRGGSRDSIESKKRIEDSLERSSPLTSKGITREKERMSMASTSTGRRVSSADTRTGFEKTKFPDDGECKSFICGFFFLRLAVFVDSTLRSSQRVTLVIA